MSSKQRLRLQSTHHPILYEVNTRVLLHELSSAAGKKVTLDAIPDALLDEWAALGFDAVWMMGVWTPGRLGIQIAREHEGLREAFGKALPDYTEADVAGSPYAVASYTVPRSLGGAKGLEGLREKLASRGIALVLDFVANHTARDHSWVSAHPEYYVAGDEGRMAGEPANYFRTKTKKGERILAFGRDPYFPGWTDTAQVNPLHPGARAALIKTLAGIAKLCDGVRCDMALLLLNDVFKKTWGDRAVPEGADPAEKEFWSEAISFVRRDHPAFLLIAEAYWDLEWPLQQLGFNFTYDKRLYDRLLREGASSVRDHLKAEMIYQKRSMRFLENHDEPRVAQVLPNEAWQFAAATIAATVPGMLLLHEGQLEGRKVRIPVQLGRRPVEEPSVLTKTFYARLLACLQADVFKAGEWKLLNVRPAWHENHSSQDILASSWRLGSMCRLIVVNYSPLNSQCYVDLDLEGMEGSSLEFRDLMNAAVYSRDRAGLQHKGMYFDMPGYGLHIFEVKAVS